LKKAGDIPYLGELTPDTFFTAALYVFALVLAGLSIRLITNLSRILRKITSLGFRLLNLLAIWVMMPIVVFVSISRYSLNEILGFGNAIAMALIGLGAVFVSSVAIARFARDDRETTIAVVINSSFMNVTFLGLPIVYALLGQGGLGPAALYAVGISVPNLVFGVIFASSAAKKRVTVGRVIESVLTFPAAFALIVALLFVAFGAFLPTIVRDTFDIYLTRPFFALMLLLVGYQMPVVNPRKYFKDLTMVSLMRFIVSPLVTYLIIFALGLNFKTDITPKPAMILSIMPPAIFNFILAWNYKLDTKLYSSLIFYPTVLFLFVAFPILSMLIF
jgi:predicted permease